MFLFVDKNVLIHMWNFPLRDTVKIHKIWSYFLNDVFKQDSLICIWNKRKFDYFEFTILILWIYLYIMASSLWIIMFQTWNWHHCNDLVIHNRKRAMERPDIIGMSFGRLHQEGSCIFALPRESLAHSLQITEGRGPTEGR